MTGQTVDIPLIEALRGRGQRVTSQRVLMHRALRERDRHFTAEELLDAMGGRLPNLSLPTVYATLELFQEMGIVRRVSRASGPTLFDSRTDEHGHVVCRSCGNVSDLDTTGQSAAAMAGAQRQGFTAEHAEVVVSGLCADCTHTA